MSVTEETLFQRIRDTVARLTHTPERALSPVEEHEDKARLSVRHLARSRVSQMLRQLRATHGLTYAQIQEQTGIAQQVLFDVEYKDRRLTLDELRLLLQCYNVSVNDVLGIDVE